MASAVSENFGLFPRPRSDVMKSSVSLMLFHTESYAPSREKLPPRGSGTRGPALMVKFSSDARSDGPGSETSFTMADGTRVCNKRKRKQTKSGLSLCLSRVQSTPKVSSIVEFEDNFGQTTWCFLISPCVFEGNKRQNVSQLAQFSEMGPMFL